ncbi:MAG: GAF domain-containing protein, partial [Myxococcales bacterium]|nr:GAF domain-containing protein [Myxococcales bacterium]
MAWLDVRHTVRDDRRTHRLHKVLTTIGRARGNDLVLDDAGLAESHATVLRQGTAWSVASNDRQASLFVDGRRTRQASLGPGTELMLGAWKVVFREGEPVAEQTEERVALSLLEELVQISSEMMRDTTPQRLFATLLQGLVRVTRAEKGFIILLRDGDRQLAAVHNVSDEVLDLSRISDSIVDRVVQTLEPVIVSDALHDTHFGRATSVVDLKLSSVMCVPLLYRNDLLGVLYLGNDAITGLFTDADLAMLQVWASQAS